MPKARITVTLPHDIVSDIDRRERNRSRFILEAVEHELENRRRQELLASVENPHQQSEEIAEAGLKEWGDWADDEDEDLLDAEAGRSVRWSPGRGWAETD
ncbi:MAG: hypothetical protein OES47_04490 [Acidobacteriota bacterium]|nr:hypothetical protein [Acidobacteriota bacterium]